LRGRIQPCRQKKHGSENFSGSEIDEHGGDKREQQAF
jgi:hypothetical protein